MDVKLTQWKKFGDHPLVKKSTVREFPYTELNNEGCGCINGFIIVRPNDYIVEINNVFISVIDEHTAKELINNKQ